MERERVGWFEEERLLPDTRNWHKVKLLVCSPSEPLPILLGKTARSLGFPDGRQKVSAFHFPPWSSSVIKFVRQIFQVKVCRLWIQGECMYVAGCVRLVSVG